ncbi:MAG: hypothetical protein ACRD09_06725 [Vicinamibacterales bacterium]
MLIRQNAPVLGASSNLYQQPGEWQISVAARGLESDTHYRLDERQVEREELATYVVNRQYATDVTATYAFNRQLSLSVGVPFTAASWSIPSPTGPALGPRAQQDARGLGDMSVGGRYWIGNAEHCVNGNVSVGLGVKMPTGEDRAQDLFPDRNGQNNQLRFVDQSVQPGDGGWGLMADIQGFRRVGVRGQVFASGSYLANPRDTNDTPSLTVSRLPPGVPPPANSDRLVNSVPDQYLVRAGAAYAVTRRIGVMGAYRLEGQRRYDLIGKSHGFRRPGVAMFIEPGVSIDTGPGAMWMALPVSFYVNRKPDPYTGNQGDATFPKVIFLAGYQFRFGGRAAPVATESK